MTIKTLSDQTKIPISTIRYYEKNGLLPEPKRLPNNYRDYDALWTQYLEFIHYMTSLGFSLKTIKEIIRHIEKGTISKTYILSLLNQQNEKVQSQLQQLQRLNQQILDLSTQTNEIDDFLDTVSKLFP